MENWFIAVGAIVAVVTVLVLTGKVAFTVLNSVINVAWKIAKGIIKATISLVIIGIMLATIALGVVIVKANSNDKVNVRHTNLPTHCYKGQSESGTYTVCDYSK